MRFRTSAGATMLVLVQLGAVLSNQSPVGCEVCTANTGHHRPTTSSHHYANDTICTTLSFEPHVEGVSSDGLPTCTACTDEGFLWVPTTVASDPDQELCLNVTYKRRIIETHSFHF